MRLPLTRLQRQAISELFPTTNKTVAEVVIYILQEFVRGQDLEIQLTNYQLSLAEGKESAYNNRNYYKPDQLIEATKKVLPFIVKPLIPGEPRHIKLSLSDTQAKRVIEIFSLVEKSKNYVLPNGKVANEKNLRLEEKNAQKIRTNSVTEDVEQIRLIADYHNNLDKKIFTSRIDKNLSCAVELTKNENQAKQASLNEYLRGLRTYPKTYLKPSNLSARLAPIGQVSWTNCPKELRRALLPEAIELDLANCHLAVASKLWGCTSLTDLLQQGSIWDYAFDTLDIPRCYKPALKKYTYSLAYGSPKPTKHFVSEVQRLNLPTDNLEAILGRLEGSTIFSDLLSSRDAYLDTLRGKQNLETVLGYSIPVGKNLDGLRSTLSLEIQAYETLFVSEIYRLSRDETRFTVLVYSYDGVSLEVDSAYRYQTDSITKDLQSAVQSLATKHGIPTRLTVDS